MPALSSLAARDTAIERRSILFGFVHQATSLLQLNDYQAPEIAPAVRSGSRTAPTVCSPLQRRLQHNIFDMDQDQIDGN